MMSGASRAHAAGQVSEALAEEVRDAERQAAGLRRELAIRAGTEQQFARRGTTQARGCLASARLARQPWQAAEVPAVSGLPGTLCSAQSNTTTSFLHACLARRESRAARAKPASPDDMTDVSKACLYAYMCIQSVHP